jgi:hypothetical protein
MIIVIIIVADNGQPRRGTVPVELLAIDVRSKDPRPNRPYFVFEQVNKKKQKISDKIGMIFVVGRPV